MFCVEVLCERLLEGDESSSSSSCSSLRLSMLPVLYLEGPKTSVLAEEMSLAYPGNDCERTTSVRDSGKGEN